MSETDNLNKNGRRIKKSTRVWLVVSAILLTVFVIFYVVMTLKVSSRDERIDELDSKLKAYTELSKKIGVGKKLSREDIGGIFSTYEIVTEKRDEGIYYKLNPNLNIRDFDGFYVMTDSAMNVKDFGFIDNND